MGKIKYFILSLLTIIAASVYGQSNVDPLIANDAKYELRNDTFFLNSGLKISIGQKLITGNGAGINGQYRSIISDYAAVVPRIWGKNPNYENDIENHVDDKRGRKQMKELTSGQYFTIKKILLAGNKKKYHYFLAFLSSHKYNYKCDIVLALNLGELLLSR